MKFTQAWPLVLGLGLGVFLGFFFVFAGVFSDGPTSLVHPERLLSFGLVVGSYFAATFGVTRWSPLPFTMAWGVVCAPAFGMLLSYAVREPGILGLGIVYLVLAAASSYGGMRLALAARRRARQAAP